MNKKLLVGFTTIAFILGACSSNSSTIPENTTVPSDIVEQSDTALPATAPLASNPSKDLSDCTSLVDIFQSLAVKVGIMSFDECRSLLSSTSFEYQINPTTEDHLCNISLPGEDGFSLNIYFFPENNQEIMTLLSYNNGDFEGSVTDNLHMTERQYGIHDAYSPKPNTSVNSIEEVVDYIVNIIPTKVQEHENDFEDLQPIDVSLDITASQEDGLVVFTVSTNLPDGTTLLLNLTNADSSYHANDNITVNNGVAISSGFSDKGFALSGHYTLSLSMSYAQFQSDAVIQKIGQHGEALTGQYVISAPVEDGGNRIHYDIDFDF